MNSCVPAVVGSPEHSHPAGLTRRFEVQAGAPSCCPEPQHHSLGLAASTSGLQCPPKCLSEQNSPHATAAAAPEWSAAVSWLESRAANQLWACSRAPGRFLSTYCQLFPGLPLLVDSSAVQKGETTVLRNSHQCGENLMRKSFPWASCLGFSDDPLEGKSFLGYLIGCPTPQGSCPALCGFRRDLGRGFATSLCSKGENSDGGAFSKQSQ